MTWVHRTEKRARSHHLRGRRAGDGRADGRRRRGRKARGARGARRTGRQLRQRRARHRDSRGRRRLPRVHQTAAPRRGAALHQEPAAAVAPDHAGARNARGDRLQAAGDAAGNSGNSRRKLRRRHPDAARKAPDHHGRTQTGDRAAHPLPHLEGVHDALWLERSRRSAQPQGVRGAGARSAGHRRWSCGSGAGGSSDQPSANLRSTLRDLRSHRPALPLPTTRRQRRDAGKAATRRTAGAEASRSDAATGAERADTPDRRECHECTRGVSSRRENTVEQNTEDADDGSGAAQRSKEAAGESR